MHNIEQWFCYSKVRKNIVTYKWMEIYLLKKYTKLMLNILHFLSNRKKVNIKKAIYFERSHCLTWLLENLTAKMMNSNHSSLNGSFHLPSDYHPSYGYYSVRKTDYSWPMLKMMIIMMMVTLHSIIMSMNYYCEVDDG